MQFKEEYFPLISWDLILAASFCICLSFESLCTECFVRLKSWVAVIVQCPSCLSGHGEPLSLLTVLDCYSA